MSGYTPVFDSVYHGTLCGRWPTLPVWLTILPMADKNGHIDLTYQAISALTGWPIDLLKQAIVELMQPDPDSRSALEEGRRLALIDPENRNWGWRVVNHTHYREKARKAAYDAVRTESGHDADRKRNQRVASPAMSRDVPRSPDVSRDSPTCPADSRAVPLSNTNTNTNTESKRARKRASRRCPEDFTPDLEYARAQIADIDAEGEARKFRDWEFKTPRSDWPACWRTWIANAKERGQYARKETRRWE